MTVLATGTEAEHEAAGPALAKASGSTHLLVGFKILVSQQEQVHSLELNYTSIYFTPFDP